MNFFKNRKNAVESTEVPVNEGLSTSVSAMDAAAELQKFQKAHKWDLFMDTDRLDTIDAVVASGDVEKEAALEESLLEEDSPYAEVRIAVCHEYFELHSLYSHFIRFALLMILNSLSTPSEHGPLVLFSAQLLAPAMFSSLCDQNSFTSHRRSFN